MTAVQQEQTRRALIARVVSDPQVLLMERDRIMAAWAPYLAPAITLH